MADLLRGLEIARLLEGLWNYIPHSVRITDENFPLGIPNSLMVFVTMVVTMQLSNSSLFARHLCHMTCGGNAVEAVENVELLQTLESCQLLLLGTGSGADPA